MLGDGDPPFTVFLVYGARLIGKEPFSLNTLCLGYALWVECASKILHLSHLLTVPFDADPRLNLYECR